MNEVFIIGKIVSKVEFKFIYKGKHTSKSTCYMELNNKTVIQIAGYDNMADFLYRKVKEKKKVFIYGKIQNNNIIINELVML